VITDAIELLAQVEPDGLAGSGAGGDVVVEDDELDMVGVILPEYKGSRATLVYIYTD